MSKSLKKSYLQNRFFAENPRSFSPVVWRAGVSALEVEREKERERKREVGVHACGMCDIYVWRERESFLSFSFVFSRVCVGESGGLSHTICGQSLFG